MGKKIYINGGILVNTRYFACKNVICPCDVIPNDALFFDPPLIKDNQLFPNQGEVKCLIIDEDHPQSLFNEYYCKTFFTSLYEGIDYLNMTSNNCLCEFSEGIEETKILVNSISNSNKEFCEILYKMAYLHILSCFDSYVCSLMLSIIAHNEHLFVKFHDKLLSSSKKSYLLKYLIEDNRAKWEKGVVEEILHLSFCNMSRINDCFALLKKTCPKDEYEVIEKHFEKRHLLIHRNGKMMKGGKLIIDKETVESVIDDIYRFGNKIMQTLESSI